jgi:hypothetical protein
MNAKKEIYKIAAAALIGCGFAAVQGHAYDALECDRCGFYNRVCEDDANWDYNDCINNGGSEEACNAGRNEALANCDAELDTCIEENCC